MRYGNKILILFISLALIFSFSGITSAETLRVWWWGEADVPGSRIFMEEAAQTFEEKHGVTVNLVEQTSDELLPAFRSAAAAGSGPDIQFFFSGSWIMEDIWLGNLDPINNFFSDEEMESWLFKDAYSFDNKLWAAPWYSMSVVMIYNKDLFAEADLDPESPPETWDEFITACDKLKEAGITPFGYGVRSPWANSWLSALFLLEDFDNVDQIKNMAVEEDGFITEEVLNMFEMLHTLKDKNYINENIMSLDYSQARDEFLRGEAAVSIASSADVQNIINEMGEDTVWVMPTPSYGDGDFRGNVVTQVQLFSIPTFADNKDLAAEFLDFLQSEEQLYNYYQITGAFPANENFKEEWLETDIDRKLYEMQQNAGPYVDLYLPPMIGDEAIYPTIQLIFAGELTPEEAMEEIERTAQRWRRMNPQQLNNFKDWADN